MEEEAMPAKVSLYAKDTTMPKTERIIIFTKMVIQVKELFQVYIIMFA